MDIEESTQREQEFYLIDRGFPAEDVDFYHMKVSRLVTPGKSFEEAAEEFIESGGVRKRYTGPIVEFESKPKVRNINDFIRRSARR